MPGTRLLAWIRALLFRRRIEADLDREMRLHLDLETAANVRAGMAPDDARRKAVLAFGGVDAVKEEYRDALGTRFVDETWQDLRYAGRLARRSPGFTTTGLLLLALAVGTASAIFSIGYSVLVRPLPFPHPGRLVFISEAKAGVSWPDYLDWRARATVFDGLAASISDAVTRTGGPTLERIDARSVTSNFFHVLGVEPLHGRLFAADDARLDAAPTAVISYAMWARELGGNPAAIGKTLTLTIGTFTVIGVLPPTFRYMAPADVFLLLEPRVAREDFDGMQSRSNHAPLYVVGRLKPGVSVQAAETQMHTIAMALSHEYPATNKGGDVPVLSLRDRIVGGTAPTLIVLAGAVALLLLIACTNLASLLASRAMARAHEFSVRAAIGAGRGRLVRQLVIEQMLFVVAGGVLGALAGAAILAALVRAAPADLPRLDEIHLNLAVLGWTTLVGCGCALAFGIGPALRVSRSSRAAAALRSGKRSTSAGSPLRRAVMIVEIAVATVLLFGAGLMIHTMARLAGVDLGFDPRDLQTFSISLPGPRWAGPAGDARKALFFDGVLARLRAVPGVENATLSYSLPTAGSKWWSPFTIAGRSVDPRSFGPNAGMAPVGREYFETLHIPLIKGRLFDNSDTPLSVPVAVVNRTLATMYWPGDDPIGKQIRGGSPGSQYGPWRTIVGIVGDTKDLGVDQATPQQIFMPIVQAPNSPVFAIVRTRGAVPLTSLVSAVHDLDASAVVFNDRTLEQVLHAASSRRRFAMILLSVFGGVAVMLAAVGLYGVIAQSVSERRNEIGIRVSLGATQGQVVRMFLERGVVVAAFGLGFGLIAALAASRSLESMVFGLGTRDPLTLAGVVLLVGTVAFAASYLPARAAAEVDPQIALRGE